MTVLNVTYDEKRCGYFVQGSGFDFFAYFTGDINEETNLMENYIECDGVVREGSDLDAHISIPLHGCSRLSNDIMETKILEALRVYWPDL